MRRRVALAGAALAVAGLVLVAAPGSAASVALPVLSPADSGCCAATGEVVGTSRISDAQSIASLDAGQSEPSDPATVGNGAKDGPEWAGVSLGTDEAANGESGGSGDGAADGENLIASPDESFLTRFVARLIRLGGVVAPRR